MGAGGVAAGRMIWSMTRMTRSVVGASPTRKKRCSTIPARAGASSSMSTSSRISPRSLARWKSALEPASLGASTSRRNASAKSASRVIAVRMAPKVSTSGLSVESAVAAERRDQVAAQGAGVDRSLLDRGVLWPWCSASMTRLTLPFQRR